MVEYRRVLSRFERLREDADALLEMIGTGENVLFVTPVERLHLISSDPSDDKFLECALAAEADLIISGDRHLLALGEFRGLSILDPAQALPLLTAGENPSPAE
jgi:predicted nucleic acid-binding protein